MATRFGESIVFGSTVHFGGVVTGMANSITNAMIQAAAAISASKLINRHDITLAQDSGSAAAAQTRVMHVAQFGGTIRGVSVTQLVAATGDSTVTVDVKKNGTTILTATITIDNADAARAVQDGTLNVTSYSADDVFELVITVSAGTGTLPQGVAVQLQLDEAGI